MAKKKPQAKPMPAKPEKKVKAKPEPMTAEIALRIGNVTVKASLTLREMRDLEHKIHEEIVYLISAQGRKEKEDAQPGVTIGERLLALRQEAGSVAEEIEEDDGSNDEYDTDEGDREQAVGFLRDLEKFPKPSDQIAGLVVKYPSRTDWKGLDRAKDMRDEIQEIDKAVEASGIEAKEWSEALNELGGMWEF